VEHLQLWTRPAVSVPAQLRVLFNYLMETSIINGS